MSEHDAAPDPIDKAYLQAEALLNDDDARAARRARILTAIARKPSTPVLGAASTRHSPAWRRGGWLAAAGVAGFGLLWAADLDQPAHRQTSSTVTTAPPPTAATQQRPVVPTTSAKALSTVATSAPRRSASPAGPVRSSSAPASAPPPAPAVLARAARAFPAEPAPGAAPPADIATPALPLPQIRTPQAESIAPPQPVPPSPPAPAAPPPPPAALSRREAYLASPADKAERLRAAATGGRLAEIQALLAQGAPIDAADADGTTALMNSIKADHPAVAALLRDYGASLDQRNRAGLSARDMAKAADDPALQQALGLGR
jgi:hypothetical protein